MDDGRRADGVASPAALRLGSRRWLDTRAVLGIVLLLGSMVGGARLFAAASRETTVWAAAHDLAPGERVAAGDLTPVRVRLNEAAAGYLTGAAPAGYVVVRFVAARELLPAAALAASPRTDSSRLVTVPVQAGHLPPDLAPGDRVDVYLSPRSAGGSSTSGPAPPSLVLAAAVVQARPSGGRTFGADAALSVVLVVPADRVADVVRAAESGAVDLVAVPAGAGGGT